MNGNIGSIEIKPDQMHLINSCLILIFIPLYEVLFYPVLKRFGLKTPLQKMTFGGILAGIAFVIAALVEICLLVPSYAEIPKHGEAQLRIINGINCNVTFSTNIYKHDDFVLEPFAKFEAKNVYATNYNYTVKGCGSETQSVFHLNKNSGHLVFLTKDDEGQFVITNYDDPPQPSKNNHPILRILVSGSNKVSRLSLLDGEGTLRWLQSRDKGDLMSLTSGDFKLLQDHTKIGSNISLKKGGVYTLLMIDSDEDSEVVS